MTKKELRSVVKSGNSLCINLPSQWCFDNQIVKGSKLSIDAEKDSLSIRPVDKNQPQEAAINEESIQNEVTPEQPQQHSGIDIQALVTKALEEHSMRR